MASNQSLNHLLNFSLPPRQAHQYQSLPRRRKPATHQVVWNKERFINAQYRFVVNPSGDYTVHFADPDIFFQWQDILQVIIPRSSALASAAGSGQISGHDEGLTTCPICLSPPTAPRMTKCGHVRIYWSHCTVQYLTSNTDNLKWARCPICFDSVNERQLKAVKWIDVALMDEEDNTPPVPSSSSSNADYGLDSGPRLGSVLRMRLIQRPQITTLALPRSPTWPSDLMPPHQAPFHFLPDVGTFSKFMLATPTALITDLTKDLDDLASERHTLTSMHDHLGVIYIDMADGKLRQQMAKAAALETPQLKEAVDAARHALHHIIERAALHSRKVREDQTRSDPPEDAPDDLLASRSSGFNTPTPTVNPVSLDDSRRVSTPTRAPRQRRNLNPPPPSSSSYYYYQAASGMPIFLHPLDIKILLSYFNSYAAFPDSINVRVESYAESTVNDDLRKRCKYLAHLPEGADVVFVETDLGSVVGQEGLKNFDRALVMRRARRKEKGRKDDKARTRAEEREKEKLVNRWNELTRHDVDAYIPPSEPRVPSPVNVDNVYDFPEPGQAARPQLPPQTPSAWGRQEFRVCCTACFAGRSDKYTTKACETSARGG
ncbi:hypothetical protein EW026_g1873 [Hermanssonia centrifuga]|uniref:RING-type domain-containing protein n=1 Tax=Hermanssonia centrifuga TaxID=98765 RepID=A0A4S4KQ17_9APHY|nr:hypothetical protein EW026_g1873 [Hermanssonia centrifuga]